MCRLLGITNFSYTKHRRLVEGFCDLARTGRVMAGDPPGHGDGWGMALFRDGQWEVHKSGADLRGERDRVLNLLRSAGTCPVLILHLRKAAWSHSATTRHAHPFQHGNVVFAHNGTVYSYRSLIPDISVPGLEEDALDTEVFFLYFLSDPSPDLGKSFLKTVARIKREADFSALNCLFSDGKKLFAYRDYSREPDYYSLFKASAGRSCFVCSEPVGGQPGWEPMAREELLVVVPPE